MEMSLAYMQMNCEPAAHLINAVFDNLEAKKIFQNV